MIRSSVWHQPIEGHLAFATKRMMDIVGATLLLILMSPCMLLVALLIKMSDGGPAIIWQTRVGRNGRHFRFPKFRSMVVNAQELRQSLEAHNQHGESAVTFKMKNDPRVTPLGRIIRKLSVDELPQLWNVLRGEMSLVGPRPPLPSEVEKYTARQRRRLDVTPGLTCIWQVSGRGDLAFETQVQMDLDYIDNWSLAMDVDLLVRTIPAVLKGRGAY